MNSKTYILDATFYSKSSFILLNKAICFSKFKINSISRVFLSINDFFREFNAF